MNKRFIQPHDIEKKKVIFNKSKAVHEIMSLTALQLGAKVSDLYYKWGWYLYENFPHAYDAIKLSLTQPDKAFAYAGISEKHKAALIMNIKSK